MQDDDVVDGNEVHRCNTWARLCIFNEHLPV